MLAPLSTTEPLAMEGITVEECIITLKCHISERIMNFVGVATLIPVLKRVYLHSFFFVYNAKIFLYNVVGFVGFSEREVLKEECNKEGVINYE